MQSCAHWVGIPPTVIIGPRRQIVSRTAVCGVVALVPESFTG